MRGGLDLANTSPAERHGLLPGMLLASLSFDLGDDLDGLITYDNRFAESAEANGIAVASPT